MARAEKHRYSLEGGYARGEETRTRIIAAAMKLFGERGYEGASTRDIAASAGVNAPALQYYFDNKEGVYVACAEHIVSRVWDHISSAVESAARTLADNADDDALIEAFCAIQAKIADMMLTVHRPDDNWRLFMAREQAGLGPAAGFQIVNERLNQRLYVVTGAIVGRLLGRARDDDETLIRTMALSGQQLFFHVLRRTALSILNWDGFNAERAALIKRVIGEQTAAILRLMAATRGADSVRA